MPISFLGNLLEGRHPPKHCLSYLCPLAAALCSPLCNTEVPVSPSLQHWGSVALWGSCHSSLQKRNDHQPLTDLADGEGHSVSSVLQKGLAEGSRGRMLAARPAVIRCSLSSCFYSYWVGWVEMLTVIVVRADKLRSWLKQALWESGCLWWLAVLRTALASWYRILLTSAKSENNVTSLLKTLRWLSISLRRRSKFLLWPRRPLPDLVPLPPHSCPNPVPLS